MVQPAPSKTMCPQCHQPVEPTARFCRFCGVSLRPGAASGADSAEMVLPAPRRLRINGDRINVRELQQMVTHSLEWWNQRLKSGEATREEAAASVEELRQALGSMAAQLEQGRETVRITTSLPAARRFPVGCPRCGKGNRLHARFCFSCGRPFAAPLERPSTLPARLTWTPGLVSDTGVRRSVNQDAGIYRSLTLADGTPALLCAVADGMGGARGGAEASAIAIRTLTTHITGLVSSVNKSYTGWRDVVRAAIVAANSAIFRAAQKHPDLNGMGTTIVLALLIDDRAIIGSVGDSRMYLLNPKGVADAACRITQLTVDHTMVARLVDIGQLTPEQARTHPRRNVLYRSAGVEPNIEVDVDEQPLQDGDHLLLCSDGLTNELADSELFDLVNLAETPQAACEALIAVANNRGARDNVTALVVAISE